MTRALFTPRRLSVPEPLYFENRPSPTFSEPPDDDPQDDGRGRERAPTQRSTASLSLIENTERPRPCPSFLREVDSFVSSRSNILAATEQHKTWSQSSISASVLSLPQDDPKANTGLVHVTKHFKHGRIYVDADMSGSIAATAEYTPLRALRVNGMLDSDGFGWLGCHTRTQFGRQNRFHLGAWHEYQSPSKFASALDATVQQLGCHAAIDLFPHRVMMAVEATAPVTTMKPSFSYQLITELNDARDSPLLLSAHQSPKRTALQLRGIRKDTSLAWRVEMETKPDKAQPTSFKAGLLFPINRTGTMSIEATPSQLTGEVAFHTNKKTNTMLSATFGLDSNCPRMTGVALKLGF